MLISNLPLLLIASSQFLGFNNEKSSPKAVNYHQRWFKDSVKHNNVATVQVVTQILMIKNEWSPSLCWREPKIAKSKICNQIFLKTNQKPDYLYY